MPMSGTHRRSHQIRYITPMIIWVAVLESVPSIEGENTRLHTKIGFAFFRGIQIAQRRNDCRERMTSKDNIIYYTITAVVFVGIVMCSLLFHTDGQLSMGDATNKEKQLVIDKINAFAPIINAITVLLSFGFVIWTTCFRKTRRNRIDELKVEVLEVVSTVKGHEDWIAAMGLSEIQGDAGIVNVKDLSNLLRSKYQKKKWYELLPVVLTELRNEGYHEPLGLSPMTKISTQPHKIIVR